MNADQRMQAPASAGEASTPDDPSAIERVIRDTRSELGRTIDALQERLNPTALKTQATDAVREATVGRAEEFAENAKETARGVGTQMIQTIRENPIPAAMAGAGLFWLWRKSRENGDHEYEPRAGSRTWEAYTRNPQQGYSTGERYAGQAGYGYRGAQGEGSGQSYESEGMMSRAGEMASGVADHAQGAVGQVAEGVQAASGAVAGGIHTSADAVAGGVGSMAGTARATGNQLQEWMRERPLVVAGAAVALGATIGMALPETEKERELMGSMSEDVMERAKSTAQTAQQKVMSAAEEAATSAQEAVAR